jgi:hypothetical protein
MRALPIAAVILLGFGCLDGDYNPDMSVPRDLTPPIYDLAGVDLYGAYNCSQLNACERACTNKSCVYLCRLKATPHAVGHLHDVRRQYLHPRGPGLSVDAESVGVSPVRAAGQRLHGGRLMARRGRILAVKWGYNPNSSSLGVDVTFLLFGMAAIALLTPIISLFLRARRARLKPPLDSAPPQA